MMDMENSVCESPKQQQGENPDDGDFDDIVQSLQNLDLGDAIDEYIKLSNCSTINVNQISSSQWKSDSSDHESIWGYRFFTYERKEIDLKQARVLFHICVTITNPNPTAIL
ncbi:hypothetical protein OROGR_021381 [Orobanche gracilis]